MAIILKVFFIDIMKVEGKSMANTVIHAEKLLIDKFTYQLRNPKRGEIIIFDDPLDQQHMVIKRVVALEGETIEIIDGEAFVDNKAIEENYILEKTHDNFSKRVVPNNSVFVMGDNRKGSKDSRFEDMGFISENSIEGRAVFVIWPIENIRKIR